MPISAKTCAAVLDFMSESEQTDILLYTLELEGVEGEGWDDTLIARIIEFASSRNQDWDEPIAYTRDYLVPALRAIFLRAQHIGEP